MQFSKNLSENMKQLQKTLQVDTNFDVVYRTIQIGGREACLYFVDGFTKDEVLLRLIQGFTSLKPDDMPEDAHGFSKKYLPYGEVGLIKDENTMVTQLLMGITCLFIDGYDSCLTIDCRTYPARSVGEPEKDKVLRGSRDGFVETLIFNTALIRRRIRDPKLTMEIMTAGESSHTDIAICYMKNRVDENLLYMIKTRIENLHVDALTMNQESLAECIYPHKWYNPFPKFKFSERPDTAAASILEGNIIILVDNSPAAMILPSSVFDIIEEADDYYFPPVTGTYLRLSRMTISLLSLLLTPIWLLLIQNPDYIPSWLEFIQLADETHVPIIWQLLILEFAIDGLRLAAVNTPSMLTTPLSVIAGIVLGEYSVKSGWFNSETMLYMAFVTIANYSQSSFELGYALKFMRVIILILTAVFNVWGFAAGVILSVCAVVFNKTIAGKSYIYPIMPFSWNEIRKRFLRGRLPHTDKASH
ncbi:spore germination protein [Clostridium sp. AM58-1XD]|uniref:spore germination protein n=1 Tax=Clostridium sp. AM58-1XD TaxID=2292307 RepID=UPI000E513264|nr:spore germination protein [Clostridium sp. AM58-1XD]RGY99655.1 spore germination protein [Clostridium sp. AM58-1XD]